MRHTLLSILFTLAAVVASAGSPVSWSFGTKEAANGRTYVALRALCEEGWHIYALTLPRDDGPFPTIITVTPSPAFNAEATLEPAPVEEEDPNFQMLVRYHGHEVEFLIPIERLSKDAFNVAGTVEYMCCNDKTCLPPVSVEFSVPFPAAK